MRKFLIPIIAAGSALSLAVPASAQWAPPVYRYAPYNFGFGFSGMNFARSMQARVQRVRADIRTMQMRRILSWRDANNLDNQARGLQQRIFWASRNGISPREARNLERGLRNLEFRVQREATDWNRRPGFRRY